MSNDRNKPCWCGSGIKFKKCHLDRERQQAANIYEVGSKLANSRRKLCSVPSKLKGECSGGIINAHTVSKSSSLKRIAKNGHVYRLLPNVKNLNKFGGLIKPELVGLNSASTATVFCKKHDAELFSPIENQPFVWELKQVFLVIYRAFVYEWYAKLSVSNNEQTFKNLDSGRDKRGQLFVQSVMADFMKGNQIAVKEQAIFKKQFDDMLLADSFSKLKYIGFEFEEYLPVMGAGGFEPLFDLEARKIQDLGNLDKIAEPMYYASFASQGKGIFLLAWLEDYGAACEHFSRSINNLASSQIRNFIVSLMFSESENVFISPTWWDGTNEKVQFDFLRLFKEKLNFHATPKPLTIIEAFSNCNFTKYQN